MYETGLLKYSHDSVFAGTFKLSRHRQLHSYRDECVRFAYVTVLWVEGKQTYVQWTQKTESVGNVTLIGGKR
jgi:hypothetical protein